MRENAVETNRPSSLRSGEKGLKGGGVRENAVGEKEGSKGIAALVAIVSANGVREKEGSKEGATEETRGKRAQQTKRGERNRENEGSATEKRRGTLQWHQLHRGRKKKEKGARRWRRWGQLHHTVCDWDAREIGSPEIGSPASESRFRAPDVDRSFCLLMWRVGGGALSQTPLSPHHTAGRQRGNPPSDVQSAEPQDSESDP